MCRRYGFDDTQLSEDGTHSTLYTSSLSGGGNNPHDQKQVSDTALYERIEVVRGATGLKKAQSEPGGSINAIRKRPTSKPLVEFEASADRFGTVRGTADVSGLLMPEYGVRGRLVTVAERSNEFRDHTDGYKGIIYGVIDKDITENDKLTAGISYHHEEDTPSLFGLPAAADGSDLKLPRETYLGANWNNSRYKKWNVFGEWVHYFDDDWKLTTLLDYKHNKSLTTYAYVPHRGNVSAAGTVNSGYLGRSDRDSHQWTFKTDLDGKFQAFGRQHELYAGYSYSREDFDNLWRGSPLSGTYSVFNWTGNEIPKPDWDSTRYREIRQTNTDTHTLTLASRLNLTDKLHISGGVGYSRWRWSQYLSWMAKPYSNYEKGRFIPYLGMTYDLNPQNNLYASYTSIFKYTGDYYDIDSQLLPPVMGDSYEVGWKSSWWNNRFNSTLALFQTQKSNEPIDTWLGIDPATGNVRAWVRGDQAVYTPVRLQSRGLDAEISGNIGDSWRIFAGYTFNKRKYTATAAEKTVARNGRGVDFSQHTPEHMFRLLASYRLGGADGKWTLSGGVNMQSKSSPITINGQKHYLGGYAIWNAGVQYEPSKQISMGFKIHNLTDKRYYQSYGHRGTNQGHFYGEPRNITFHLKWKMK